MGTVHFKVQCSTPEIHLGLVQERWFLQTPEMLSAGSSQEVPQLPVWAAPVSQRWLATGQWLRIRRD